MLSKLGNIIDLVRSSNINLHVKFALFHRIAWIDTISRTQALDLPVGANHVRLDSHLNLNTIVPGARAVVHTAMMSSLLFLFLLQHGALKDI